MPELKVKIKTPYGQLEVSGNTPEDLLKGLEWLEKDLVAKIKEKISGVITTENQEHLKGILEVRKDGCLIVYTGKISHYETIGLILYASKDYQGSSKEIKLSLSMSGVKVMVPARLHEMVKRGHLFKPVERGSFYKLTAKGVKWMEDEVLPPLRERLAAA
jgi:hypothetical protein